MGSSLMWCAAGGDTQLRSADRNPNLVSDRSHLVSLTFCDNKEFIKAPNCTIPSKLQEKTDLHNFIAQVFPKHNVVAPVK